MVGSPTMNIHGWRQLVEWSIEYSMLNDAQKSQARFILKIEWERFCQWIIKKYADFPDKLKIQKYGDDPDEFEIQEYGDDPYRLEIQEYGDDPYGLKEEYADWRYKNEALV
jgi:hypothetical protein